MKTKLLLMIMLVPSLSFADYLVVGKQEGVSHPWLLGGLITESKIVNAYKTKNSKIMELPKVYPDGLIDKFIISKPDRDKNRGICRTVNQKMFGNANQAWEMAINYFSDLDTFYEFKNNKYNEVDVEFLTFDCIKR
jgi:hypothetical protein